ncbi:metalloprotease [Lithospermum erythrorhizon]|uniref:Metalloprotease n=1 Tax=Lithospermum erythrorhizon TaxID=34254 RepID=A0AAV3P3Z1_LITER
MQIYSQKNIFNQLSPPNNLLPYNHRTWKRRSLKFIPPPPPPLQFRCYVSSSYNNFITQIPSIKLNSLLTLGLGFASGIGILLSTRKKLISSSIRNSIKYLGEWILYTNSTPFSRFVILRCPSICFEGGGLLEGVNERLVRLIRGRVKVRESDEDGDLGEELVYRRVCVGMGDGGVVSIDWPENLELEEERGLDSTVVIVPGTTEGSGERCVREFVCEYLRRGCFPVVMNPRGCAGSPLTTPRLFTAADSDDVSTAMEYIKKARPWSTMVAVGWGYGANMLTKYLAEVGEQTPLTAATCINNPFDLEEATRCSPHHIDYDKNLTNGLVEILQSNKVSIIPFCFCFLSFLFRLSTTNSRYP